LFSIRPSRWNIVPLIIEPVEVPDKTLPIKGLLLFLSALNLGESVFWNVAINIILGI
jgi:hypothetical protein